jgi:hypothetical protein
VTTTAFPFTLPSSFGDDSAAEYLAAYLGVAHPDLNRLNAVLSIVAAQARSYTRGVGWEGLTATEDIAAVVLSAAARLLSNPNGLKEETMGALSVQYGPPFGWSLAELYCLNRFRERAK